MGAFATTAAAEVRVRALMQANIIVQGHSCRLEDGTIAIRVQRYMSGATVASGATRDGMSKPGAWDVLTDDSDT